MRKNIATIIVLFLPLFSLSAQWASEAPVSVSPDSEKTSSSKIITLDDAIKIALSDNASVQVADIEIKRSGYERKGTYSSLYPQISASGSFSRTIKKQVMTMDMGGQSVSFEVGRWNTYMGGINAALPLVNAQLWKSLEISDLSVELAVEKAKASKIDAVTQVKKAYFSVLLAKEALSVYQEVYDNAKRSCDDTALKLKAGKATELDEATAKTNLLNAVPNLYNAATSVDLALWQLKAVMGIDMQEDIDVAGALEDYAQQMMYDVNEAENYSLENNPTMRQLALQSEQLIQTVKLRKLACLPTLNMSFSYSNNAMEDTFDFAKYDWHPSSSVAFSLSIPIFSGFQRHNAIKSSVAQSTQFEIQRKDTERQLNISVRNSLNSMGTAMNSYYASIAAVQSAEKAFDIASTSYRLGGSTIVELNNAQLGLTQAKLQQSQSIYNFLTAKSTLEQTLGQVEIDIPEQ